MTTTPSGNLSAAGLGRELLGDLRQDAIPGLVAVGVVDVLEMVDVEHGERSQAGQRTLLLLALDALGHVSVRVSALDDGAGDREHKLEPAITERCPDDRQQHECAVSADDPADPGAQERHRPLRTSYLGRGTHEP